MPLDVRYGSLADIRVEISSPLYARKRTCSASKSMSDFVPIADEAPRNLGWKPRHDLDKGAPRSATSDGPERHNNRLSRLTFRWEKSGW